MKKGDKYFLKTALFWDFPAGTEVTIRAWNSSHAAVLLPNGSEKVISLNSLVKKLILKGHPLTSVFK